VEAGTQLVDSAGKTMDQIVDAVKKVSDLIAEIAAASHEQSSGIGQINTAVTHMEQVVNQNASLFEQAASMTATMKEQADALLNLVAKFNVGEGGGSVTRRFDGGSPGGRQGPGAVPVFAGGNQHLLEVGAVGA
jgi:methyl-accepting chemotaxis protein